MIRSSIKITFIIFIILTAMAVIFLNKYVFKDASIFYPDFIKNALVIGWDKTGNIKLAATEFKNWRKLAQENEELRHKNNEFIRAAAALAEPGGAAGQGGCLILPADMPLLQPCVIKLLLERAAQETATGPDRPLSLFPTCGGTSGHPVWLDYCLLPAMDKLEPDSRLRDFLLTQPHAFLECGESGILLDLDTTDAYRAARPATPQH